MNKRRIDGPVAAGWLAVSLVLAGCSNSIRFVADTVVDEDGNVVRRTELASSGDASWDAISTRYDLPPGGVSTDSIEEPDPVDANQPPQRVYDRRYTLTRRFARGDDIPGDFRRLGRRRDRAAANDIDVRVGRYWFVDTYEYQETFRDIATPESLKTAVRGLYAEIVGRFAEAIAEADGDVSPQIARDRLTARFDARVDALLSLLDAECFKQPNVTAEACLEAIDDDLAIDAIVELDNKDTLMSELIAEFPPPPGITADDWQSTLSDVYDDIYEWLDELDDTERGEALEDDIFGAHGFGLFESYPFELSLQLPGEVVGTNADTQEADMLHWAFSYEDFWIKDRVLQAKSRIVHRNRIVITAALALLAAIAGLLVVMRRRQSAGTG